MKNREKYFAIFRKKHLQKTKRIKFLEQSLKDTLNEYKKVVDDKSKLQNENTNLRLDTGRLRNEVGMLQSQVQRLGLVRDSKGQFRKA